MASLKRANFNENFRWIYMWRIETFTRTRDFCKFQRFQLFNITVACPRNATYKPQDGDFLSFCNISCMLFVKVLFKWDKVYNCLTKILFDYLIFFRYESFSSVFMSRHILPGLSRKLANRPGPLEAAVKSRLGRHYLAYISICSVLQKDIHCIVIFWFLLMFRL